MLKLKNYSFSGIGRFVEKQTIDLESRSHLIQIDGENTNTGGSSGAGKSTTVEALAYLFGISEIPATQLQSRITKSSIWVQGEFEGGITITRSKKDGLTVETPEGTVSGNSKLAEEKLDEIISVNRELLKRMCYKRQKEGGFFLNLTPKQSHEFLIQCLDLKEFQSKIYKLEDNLKNKYKPRKIELESGIEVLVGNIQQFKVLLSQKNEPSLPLYESIEGKGARIHELKTILLVSQQDYESSIRALKAKPEESAEAKFEKEEQLQFINNQLSELKQIMYKNIIAKETAMEQASSAVIKIKEKIRNANEFIQKMIESKELLKENISKRDHFKAGNCPTCLREWEIEKTSLEKIENKIESINLSIELYRIEIEKIPHYKMMEEKAIKILGEQRKRNPNVLEEKDLLELQEGHRLLQNEKDNIKSAANQIYLKALNQWTQSFNIIEQKYKEENQIYINEINQLEHDIEKINLHKKSYEDALIIFKTDIKNINDKITESYSKLNKKQEELLKIEKEVTLSEESIRLIKNFTLQKFQDTLDYIGHKATEIINNIPNMANAVIFFENAKETKSGNIKNEVNAIINLESDSQVPIKTLSGGERTSADFAIDLAVGEMIENMTQKGVDFLIIDEGLDGLDSISKIECLEILKNLNTGKKVLMVDHSSEVKEMVHDIIRVIRTGEESVIQ